MSIHHAGPKRLSAASQPYFLLGLNSAGSWVVRETTGRRAGIFRTREAAIKYVRGESAGGSFAIVYQPDGLELGEVVRFSRAA